MEKCKNFDKNIKDCNCTYEPCSRKGVCCECMRYHREMNEFPACFFNKTFEKTYNRSFANFEKMLKER